MLKVSTVASVLAALSLSLASSSSSAAGQDFRGPISVQGKYFVDAKGVRFMVRGVAVSDSLDGSDDRVYDMLTDKYIDQLKNSIIPKLKELNVNTIRVYNIDPTQSHALAMDALKKSGIYVMAELATADYGGNINRVSPQYTATLYKRYTSVIDEMAKYENTFSLSLGNEVVFPGLIVSNVADECKGGRSNTAKCIGLANQAIALDAAVIKSLARDMKHYLKTKSYRNIPIGVSMQDAPTINTEYKGLTNTSDVAQYYACGNLLDQRLDFVSINAYRYQNQTDKKYVLDKYVGFLNDYNVDKMPIPVYMSETGGGVDPESHRVRDWAIIGKTYGLMDPDELPGSQAIVDRYIKNMSGEIAYMLLNWKEQAGLYDGHHNLTPAPYGGSKQLAQQFGKVSSINLPLFKNEATTMSCPTNFNPALVDNPTSGTKVNVVVSKKYKEPGIVVQSGATLKTMPEDNATVSVDVLKGQEILVQTAAPNYFVVCKVPKTAPLSNGDKITEPSRAWGSTCLVNGKELP